MKVILSLGCWRGAVHIGPSPRTWVEGLHSRTGKRG